MERPEIAVVGIGATGAVLAASLLSTDPEVMLVDPKPGLAEGVKKNGIRVSGAISCQVPVRHFFAQCGDLRTRKPSVIFLATKTFHLQRVLEELTEVYQPGTKLISTHNGLGTEDLIAEKFGAEATFRMSLNFGVALTGHGEVETAFFNKPNHLGSLSKKNRKLGLQVAQLLTEGGLDTAYVDDIKLYVWKKMIHKCSLASLCAVTDRTIGGVLGFPPTREIAEACFREALAVAGAMGFDLGVDYLNQATSYLEKVGVHKDSMCQDVANKTPTEIDALGGKIVEYGRKQGVPTPYFATMTNLVKALEDSYLGK